MSLSGKWMDTRIIIPVLKRIYPGNKGKWEISDCCSQRWIEWKLFLKISQKIKEMVSSASSANKTWEQHIKLFTVTTYDYDYDTSWDLQHMLQIIKYKNPLCGVWQQYYKKCTNLPNNSLSSRANGLKVLITLEYCEFSIADLHSVEHGGEPGGHLGSKERHA